MSDNDSGSPEPDKHRGWYSRGYHPHIDSGGIVQSVTFRLGDSVPRALQERWRAESKRGGADPALLWRIAEYEDAGHGACYLRRPEIAQLVEGALLYFDGVRYRLLEWCVMPNHVHVLLEFMPGHRLADIVRSWKSYTSKQANRILGRTGIFWARDYFDRYIRDEGHLETARHYIRENPAKAGLCKTAEDWPWSSAARRAAQEIGSLGGDEQGDPAP